MPKYKKKPVVIEAELFDTDKWQQELGLSGKVSYNTKEDYFFIQTLQGQMMVTQLDYIIKGVRGQLYPCKSDIFEQTYERVYDVDQQSDSRPSCDICQDGTDTIM